MLKKLLLAIIPSSLFLVPLPAIAQWIPVSQSQQGDIFSVDQGSVRMSGNFRSFWVNVDHVNNNVAVSRILMGANCANNSFARMWLIQGDRRGQVVVNTKLTPTVEPAQYGSVNSQLVNSVCSGFINDPQLAALTRARQTNAEAISKAMETAAQMFR